MTPLSAKLKSSSQNLNLQVGLVASVVSSYFVLILFEVTA